jgi:hypothetical protein
MGGEMLKKIVLGLSALLAFQAAAVSINIELIDVKSLNQQIFDDAKVTRIPFNVGDKADYSLNLGGFLNGTMNMLVREETPEGIWLEQNIDIVIQKSKVETLFDADTGQVKKVLVDGKEQKMEDQEPPEIVESKPDTVTVPAGTFECSYVKLHDKKQNSDTDVWINPELVPIVGLIKQVAQSQMGPVTLELTGFERK